MINSLILPLLLLSAPLHLDDGHQIEAPLLKVGQVAPSSGFLIKIGDIADIQATLNGNSCLVRLAEIKDNFEKEIGASASRCSHRLSQLNRDLEDSKALNEQLKKKLSDEETFSSRLIIGASVGGALLTSALIYTLAKGGLK